MVLFQFETGLLLLLFGLQHPSHPCTVLDFCPIRILCAASSGSGWPIPCGQILSITFVSSLQLSGQARMWWLEGLWMQQEWPEHCDSSWVLNNALCILFSNNSDCLLLNPKLLCLFVTSYEHIHSTIILLRQSIFHTSPSYLWNKDLCAKWNRTRCGDGAIDGRGEATCSRLVGLATTDSAVAVCGDENGYEVSYHNTQRIAAVSLKVKRRIRIRASLCMFHFPTEAETKASKTSW